MMRAAVLAVWVASAGAVAAGEMNISQFVFRDTDRNGRFDLGESPLPGVSVLLEQEGAEPIRRDSNLSGFANFPMSADEDGKDITRPGPVRFSARVPDGYVLTTDNPVQAAEVRSFPGAPGGFAMSPPPPFVGLAPALTITAAADGVAAMTCSDGSRTLGARPAGTDLVCDAAAGPWTVDWQMEDGRRITRRVTLDDWPVRLPVAPAGTPGTVLTVETFDTIISSENIQEMAASDGFVWHNMIAVHRKFYGGWGYVNGTVSGQFSGYNSSGHPATLTSETPFEFRGAYVAAAWGDGTRAPVRFRAYRDGALVGEAAFTASNRIPVWFEPRWSDIDRLVISHDAYWQVVVDDLTLAR